MILRQKHAGGAVVFGEFVAKLVQEESTPKDGASDCKETKGGGVMVDDKGSQSHGEGKDNRRNTEVRACHHFVKGPKDRVGAGSHATEESQNSQG